MKQWSLKLRHFLSSSCQRITLIICRKLENLVICNSTLLQCLPGPRKKGLIITRCAPCWTQDWKASPIDGSASSWKLINITVRSIKSLLYIHLCRKMQNQKWGKKRQENSVTAIIKIRKWRHICLLMLVHTKQHKDTARLSKILKKQKKVLSTQFSKGYKILNHDIGCIVMIIDIVENRSQM